MESLCGDINSGYITKTCVIIWRKSYITERIVARCYVLMSISGKPLSISDITRILRFFIFFPSLLIIATPVGLVSFLVRHLSRLVNSARNHDNRCKECTRLLAGMDTVFFFREQSSRLQQTLILCGLCTLTNGQVWPFVITTNRFLRHSRRVT